MDTKEDLEEAQHTEQKNIKSSSARHTNESPYQVESKSSLRRQISLTKNLRKSKGPNKAPNSNEDPDELDLMNEDDFVRAPLNLDMEISQDAIETHQLELSKGNLQAKGPSSIGQSKQGQSKSRAKNSSDLAGASQSKPWLTRDGMRQPASLPNEPASAGQRSPHSQDQTQLLERRAVQASSNSAAWQQLAGTTGHNIAAAEDYDHRMRSPGSGSRDLPAALKTPPKVDALHGGAELAHGTAHRRTLHASN